MNEVYRPIDDCRMCHGTELMKVLDLGTQTLTGIFPKSETEPVPGGPLQLLKCQTCGLVQLAHNYNSNLLYGDNYGYRSGLNRSMVEHLGRKARRLQEIAGLTQNDLVIDIGSNDGTLLGSYTVPGLMRVGIDPTGSKFRQYYQPGIELIPECFSAAAFQRNFGSRKAKVITSIAMFYDLERPLDFVRQIVEVLADDGLWTFEQSYLPSMIATNSYDTICHEHLEYYGLKQIHYFTRQLGLKIVDLEITDVNGGSFSVTVAKQNSSHAEMTSKVDKLLAQETADGFDTAEPFQRLSQAMQSHREELLRFLEGSLSEGRRVFGYGASTKGNVILQYCGIDRQLLSCVAEVNPDKFGSFTPGTLIPIVSEADARQAEPHAFLVLPWHFRRNIVQKETAFLAAGGNLVFPLPKLEIV